MQVRLDVLVSAVARDAGLDPDRNDQDRYNVIGFINDTRREIYALPQMLSALQFQGEFVGTNVVTAGTVSVTNGQAEVTGAGTAWTAAMAGRLISIAGAPWQLVSYVTDTTHLSLESDWSATTTATTSYKLWQRDIPLPPKVERITRLIDPSQPDQPITFYPVQEFHQRYGMADNFTDPYAFTQFGSSDLGLDYLASTEYTSVNATANSPIVDFASGATLIGTVFPGDRLLLGNATTSTAFVVDRVLTDRKVSLNGYVAVTLSNQTATAMSQERLHIRAYPAIDSTKVYQFEAVKRVNDLRTNSDVIESGWYNAVLKGAVAKAFGYVRDPRQESADAKYRTETATLIRNQFKVDNPVNRMKPYIGRRYSLPNMTSDRDTGL